MPFRATLFLSSTLIPSAILLGSAMSFEQSFDVLVIGSGLAGQTAALRAASLGASTCLVTDGPLFSGSSFSTATWGLGMVSELPSADRRGPESLFKALCDVGMDMNTPEVSQTLVERSSDALSFLKSNGVTFLEPKSPEQREYVACFDHSVRAWRGFEGLKQRQALARALQQHRVTVLTNASVLSLLRDDEGRVVGALLLSSDEPLSTLHKIFQPLLVRSPATIVATGGYGALFERHLCSDSCQGVGHSLALDAGADLVNLEFVQLMLGMPSPLGAIVFNEKLYRHTSFVSKEGADAFASSGICREDVKDALECHSWHGPYTTRLQSHVIDETLDAARLAGSPCLARYDEEILGPQAPEFIRTYLSWLKTARGIDPRTPEEVGMYAHSCNGGIKIDSQARTCVDGLFACGECAGGVHGADRIGGLASVAATTFGLVAGEQATGGAVASSGNSVAYPTSPLLVSDMTPQVLDEIRIQLDRSCMVNRDAPSLQGALATLNDLESDLMASSRELTPEDVRCASQDELKCLSLVTTNRHRLQTARAVVTACLNRAESRGPHHRTDFPLTDASQARQKPISKTCL